MRDELELPSAKESITSIRKNGDPFATAPLSPITLGEATYEHPKKGIRTIAGDKRIFARAVRAYTDHEPLRSAINDLGVTYAWALEDFVVELLNAHTAPSLFFGFSGFASKGEDCGCDLEANAMLSIYRFLCSKSPNRPRLVSDGGSGAGVLALNGILADEYQIESIGFSPYQGVASMSARDQLVITRNTYQDREVLVGTLPDVLVCVGGGEGTKREAIEAVKAGNTVLLVMLRGNDNPDILAGSWHKAPKLMEANADGTLLVCEHLEDIPLALAKAQEIAKRSGWRSRREARIHTMAGLLKA